MIPEIEILPSPVRVLMRNGVPCDEIVTERPRFNFAWFKTDVMAPSAPKPRFIDFRDKPKARVGRPRIHPPKPPKPAKAERPKPPLRRPKIAYPEIVALIRAGQTYKQIGASVGVSGNAIYNLIRDERLKGNPEAIELDRKLRTCGCGKPKVAGSDMCADCRKAKKKRESGKRYLAGLSATMPVSSVRTPQDQSEAPNRINGSTEHGGRK